ncbi:MAG TPA: NAD(P)-dependent oxidoreductase [Solirubrobacterales bacterium]|nr:NAD(P)-dependent oxidoreductase [Solirubrobacterales bacterium]
MRERVLIVGSGFVARAVGRGLRAETDADILLTSTRPGAGAVDDLPVVTLDADVARNPPDQLERVRAFDPEVAVLAFGKGIDPADSLREVLLANAVYPLELVEWLRRETRCRSFVQVGTCFEYGASADGHPLAESDAPQPFNPYGAGKLAACLALRGFSEASGCQVLHVRPFTLFGPGEPARRLTPTLFDACLARTPARFSDGRQRRDFVYAADVGRFFASLLRARRRLPPWQILNLCSGDGVRVRDFVETAARVLRDRFAIAPAELRFDLPRKWQNEPDAVVGDASLARRLLGWSTTWSLEAAVADYWERHRAVRSQHSVERSWSHR